MAFVAEDWGRSVLYLTDKKCNRRFKAAPDQPIHKIQVFAEARQHHVTRLGWLYHDGWRQSKEMQFQSEMLWTLLHVVSSGFHLPGCIGGRIRCGVSVLEGVDHAELSYLWWWTRRRETIMVF